jgi:4-alpha-glucanotransferase
MKRSAGILMPIFSLPANYGIGTLGKCRYDFVDFLKRSGQSYWQILPLGPTGYRNSPYQSFSSFAGNFYFIDLDILINEGLLNKSNVENVDWGLDEEKIDYGKLYENRLNILKIAYGNRRKDSIAFEKFKVENESWLSDYDIFTSLKEYFNMRPWWDWPDEGIRLYRDSAVKKYSERLVKSVDFAKYLQFLFFKQWESLKKYAEKNNVKIIGDLPFYVAMDSADVWAGREYFDLNNKGLPNSLAGCPPDKFAKSGQLWGTPIYDWDLLKSENYSWWVKRVEGSARLYDVIRLDHFRGFDSFWAVPSNYKTAEGGKWIPGPGIEFVNAIKSKFNSTKFIAEDLGTLTQSTKIFLEKSNLPGMKVLEFAFGGNVDNEYLPHNYIKNCICYTGTHDNAPVAMWEKQAAKKEIDFAKKYFDITEKDDFSYSIIRGGMMSVADLFMAQMQDYLALEKNRRINTPGTENGNWQWRMKKNAINKALEERIATITKLYNRC